MLIIVGRMAIGEFIDVGGLPTFVTKCGKITEETKVIALVIPGKSHPLHSHCFMLIRYIEIRRSESILSGGATKILKMNLTDSDLSMKKNKPAREIMVGST